MYPDSTLILKSFVILECGYNGLRTEIYDVTVQRLLAGKESIRIFQDCFHDWMLNCSFKMRFKETNLEFRYWLLININLKDKATVRC